MIQLMVAAITDHTGQRDLWRRYLRLLLDGMRAARTTPPCPASPAMAIVSGDYLRGG